MSQRIFGSLLVCFLSAPGCGGSMGGGSDLATGFAGFQGPVIWGNLLLLALSVGIFVSTLGLRK
jgi:hypothetical protein